MALFCFEETVRFADTDMMGVAHHANYFRWFESARAAFLKAAGVGLLDLMKAGYSFPISDARCVYKVSARYGDCLGIEVDMLELSRAKIAFSYQALRRGDDVLLAAGYTRNVFTNKGGKVTRLGDEFYQPLLSFCSKGKAAAGGEP
jgi:acyl-CoA thioester hydrolase